ncbi:hypothetical protein [Chitinophaga varians]|nr:hypothetical protein [Chitinophaga varians]
MFNLCKARLLTSSTPDITHIPILYAEQPLHGIASRLKTGEDN